ncbi:membrane-spanning 4-domains subfamily A member 4A-like isoform X2 [Alosa alosa]|uniref:membrane-spanning 4-domains subfamily A member 4A-like isoform X2 n=1 Tax=Alosa sapidissima TaxID=34773 RepID=UPI001C090FE2|nr:membrane-spanning 4-domains subfamily A member 4A-like isoform X2 [Alosa sapidissima]XP_048109076.1 membrane-spanning 4-domains subfamily A member 4A-like isoform X2 [Alosa alosa]
MASSHPTVVVTETMSNTIKTTSCPGPKVTLFICDQDTFPALLHSSRTRQKYTTMSNCDPSSNGFVVVTHVYPQQSAQSDVLPQTGAVPTASSPIGKFLKGEPAVLGTVQIMTGIVVFLFGIVTAFQSSTVSSFSGIMLWGSINLKASLVVNVISTITAGISIILHSFDFIVLTDFHHSCRYEGHDTYDCWRSRALFLTRARGIAGVMIVLSVLEFIVSICVSAFVCKATCSSNTQVVVSSQVPPPFLISCASAPPLNTCEMPLFLPSLGSPFHHSRVDGPRDGKPEDLPPVYTAT